ncbi:MAG: chemotaxis protein CheD [Nitrospiraceae bacterium]|nr:MAG: chemotaxis protein CheD [Nitrospiraceae bacterium]
MRPFDKTLPVVYLSPGEMYISGKPSVVSTVLGSCVSITMYHRVLKIGAICHGLLPVCTRTLRDNCKTTCPEPYKYIDCAFMHIQQKFQTFSMNHDEIEIKLFGGAEVLLDRVKMPGNMSIGEKNIQIAKKLISQLGYNITASDTGGSVGRKLFFLPHAGDVFLKRLKKTDIVNANLRLTV